MRKVSLFMDNYEKSVSTTPEKNAVIDLSFSTPIVLNYKELNDWAERVATQLLLLGVETDEFVTYQLPNGWEFIVLTLALWKIGAVPCPLLPSLREREVKTMLESSKSRILVVTQEYRGFDYVEMAERIRAELSQPLQVFTLDSCKRVLKANQFGGLIGSDIRRDAIDERKPSSQTNAQLLYTWRSTGEPEGVLHTHETLSQLLNLYTQTLGVSKDEPMWVNAPLSHEIGFLYGMAVSLYSGTTGIYQENWEENVARKTVETYLAMTAN